MASALIRHMVTKSMDQAHGTTHTSAPNNSQTHPGGSHSQDVSFQNLYPAIIQCFTIIFAGYIAGRANMINNSQAKGIGTFVSKFCLPALLLKSMCELKFDEVNWKFLASILIAKSVIFFIVVFFAILVKRPLNLGYAGLFAIFTTQSNDFAFGYPIVQALYETSHPDYLKYIYLVAPISLVFLNPIGFILLELHKNKIKKKHSGPCALILRVFRGIAMNPIVFMTALGICCNFIFKQTVPYIIDDILTVLGGAFSASALFYLGLSLVGKVSGQTGFTLVVPVLLIICKTILLPLITWEVVDALHSGGSAQNETVSLSMYGFLYGTFPTAPSVFLYASQYSTATDIVATGMVACTFVAAPIMFISAKMMTLVVSSETEYKAQLSETSLDVSIIGMICCVWVAGVFLLSRKWRRVPHQFTMCLVISQFLACLGMIFYKVLDPSSVWQHYVQFVVLLVGVFSSRCWTAMIAMAICLERVKSLCYVLRIRVWLALFGFGIPMLSTGVLLIAARNHTKNEIDPSFHYGTEQTILSVVILMLCLLISVISLVIHQRIEDKTAKHRTFSNVDVEDQEGAASDHENIVANGDVQSKVKTVNGRTAVVKKVVGGHKDSGGGGSTNTNCHNCSNSAAFREGGALTAANIEDIIPFPRTEGSLTSSGTSTTRDSMESLLHEAIDDHTCTTVCSSEQRHECKNLLKYYTSINSDTEPPPDVIHVEATEEHDVQGDMQTSRHIVLLVLLCLSMFIGLFLCIWRLFNQETSGIYVEIEFIDGVFNYGQGFIVFAIFGLDSQLIVVPFIRRWRRMMYGVEVVTLPKSSDLDDDTRHVCEQFVKYHKKNCKSDIVKDRRYRLQSYKSVFTGTDLCDWLVEAGLVEARAESLDYGRKLLMGSVIRHVKHEHHFHDMPYFYKFMEDYNEEQ